MAWLELTLTLGVAAVALALLVRASWRTLPRAGAVAVTGLITVGAIALPASKLSRVLAESPTPVALTEVAYETSNACAKCHPAHFASWHRTYHRTMTQEATPETVLGEFDGRTLRFDDGYGRVFRDGERFFMELPNDPDLVAERGMKPGVYAVDRLVGSHEVQVYMTRRVDGTYLTLPFEWRERDKRWVTTTGNFLQPPDDVALFGHTAEWNGSCAFCHNTKVNPGLNLDAGPSETLYDTELEEMGVACEACHGPGAIHQRKNQNPLRRQVLHVTGREDPTIVNPAKLDKVRSIEVCGRCHGKWYARAGQLEHTLTQPDPYVPAQMPLAEVYEDPFMLKRRGEDVVGYLWPDGTPRPTAMEFQGVSLSQCFRRGEMTCGSCHSMHAAPADDQLIAYDDLATPEREDDVLCTQCHEEFLEPYQREAHSRHSATVGCVECHMPYQTFGLMKAVRTHRVANPNPKATEHDGLPNACTQCHVDKPLRWASRHLHEWYGEPQAQSKLPDERLPATAVELLRGHALTRALAAFALGNSTSPAQGISWRVGMLVDALEDDYAAVRHIAWEGVQRLLGERASSYAFDYIGVPGERKALISRMRAELGPFPLPPRAEAERLEALLANRDRQPIFVLE